MLEDLLNQFGNPKDASHNFTQDEMNYLYNLGVRHLQVNDYEKAIPLFQMLVSCDSTNSLYVKALASAMQGSGNYSSALFSYKFAYVLDNAKNADCLFYCGVCYFNLGNFDSAKSEFELFLTTKSANKEMNERSKLYIEASIRNAAKAAKGDANKDK